MQRQRLEAIARLAAERDLFIVSDEIYRELVFAPAKAESIAQVSEDAAQRTLVVDGVSKSHSMTGWRIGYTLGPKPVIEAMGRIQSHSTSNPTTVSQYAALEALNGSREPLAQMKKQFERRRDLIVGGLNAVPSLRCFRPDGAFYAWCNVEGLGRTSEEIALRWLEDAFVATVPGEGFGAPGWIRFSFATEDSVIQEGIDRIGRWVKERRSAP